MPNTRTRSPQARLQSGQAIVLIALLILVLFGMLGLAIDSGRAYVDRRDQQAAVDAAALSAGDWYENYHDLYGYSIPQSVQLYAVDMHLYGAIPSPAHTFANVGPNANLPQDTYTYVWASGYELDITATNTQFNGYDFTYFSTHGLPLAFMQIFGGPTKATITATATAVVGDQRQTPALLTLSSGNCAMVLTGSASLTVLGDTYTNGSACIDSNLNEAGNCYGGAGSNCDVAQYYCYNSTPGFVPYPPPCKPGDTIGTAVVPAPTLPDPGYLAPSVPYYNLAQGYSQNNRGTWTEMHPGTYASFHLSGGSASCAFLDAGVYTWQAGYTSDATGSLLSNELKAPDEENAAAPLSLGGGVANPQFWDMNGAGCAGHFTVTVTTAAGYGIKHGGLGLGNWGVVLTSARYDQFLDPTILPDPCLGSPGCYRESAPSQCVQVTTLDVKDQVIDVAITQNAPGAEYYNVYMDPNGCENNQGNFSFVNQFVAPGWTDGGGPPASWAGGAYPNGGAGIVLTKGRLGWPCAAATHTVCAVTSTGLSATNSSCWAQARAKYCQTPDDELGPQCFSNCPPPAGLLSQENPPFSLEYGAYTGGDEANENTCRLSPNPGDPTAPCSSSKITPGAVQFYFSDGSCMTQNAQGATYVFSGLQYNWIVIYMTPANSCSNTMNGGASTQYIGTIYTPAASWKINGGDRSPLAGQVICYTASVSGSGSVGIDFNPNYSPTPPAARLIN